MSDESKPTRLGGAANLATIAASFVAVFALGFGYYQFQATQVLTRQTLQLQKDALRHEQEAKAIDLFLKFNEVQQGMSPTRGKTKDALYWQQNIAMTITESVFKLTQGDAGWMATVEFMLREQVDFLTKDGLECDTFLPDFIELVKKVAEQDVCH